MIRAYDKSYLEDAMLNLAVALDYGSIACAGGIDEFYDRMLAGNVIRQFEKGNPKYVSGLSGIELGKRLLKAQAAMPGTITMCLMNVLPFSGQAGCWHIFNGTPISHLNP